jgi:ferredoxin
MCEPECPVDAILSEDDLPEDQTEFLEINEELSTQWPVLTVRKDPPDDAAEWEKVKDKRQYLDR